MTEDERFFPRKIRVERHLEVSLSSVEDIQQERLYEADQTHVEGRPLFLGFAFSWRRFVWTGVCMATLVGLLIARAVWMQGVQGGQYFALSENNRLRSTPIWPRRGVIRDRNGVVIAENAPRFQVTLIPRDVPDDDTRLIELADASRLLGLSVNDLQPLVSATGTRADEPVLVADAVPYDQAMAFAVALPNLPGFSLDARPKRSYPQSVQISSLSHLLGYVGKISDSELKTRKNQGYFRVDELGKTGLERTYEPILRGTVGSRTYEADARGHLRGVVHEQTPTDGQDVHLTIDLRLQREAERLLQEELTREHYTRGAVVAMDPRNGDVLALVSLPSYDNNVFSGGVSSTVYQALSNNPDQPLFNRAIAGAYPSGSTVKIVVSVAALMEHVITPQTTVLSTGGIRLGQWFFPDWKAGGHGTVDVRKAIAWSVNTFFYLSGGGGQQGIIGLGPDHLSKWMQLFGLGKKTGIDLTSESAGFVPTRSWKEDVRKQPWYIGDTYNLSIGQGDLLVTPLQVAAYTAAVANGGVLVRPRLSDLQSIQASAPLATSDTVETVRLGMRDAVTYGSARTLSMLPFSSGAKTGTAQWNKTKNTHAWFTSFAPFENPQIVVTVLVEEGGEGSHSAAPVAKGVLDFWNKLQKLEK